MSFPKYHKVALLIETSTGMGRSLLQGISHFSNLNGPWLFQISPDDVSQTMSRIRQDDCHGVIARLTNKSDARLILRAGIPTVAIGALSEGLLKGLSKAKIAEASSNPDEVARLAANHLIGRNIKHFAFVGCEERGWSQRREAAFVKILGERGYQPVIYRQPRGRTQRVWERERHILADWLSKQSLPLGILACDDERGRQVIEACSLAERSVPQEIAVIGVDNDELFCDMADPPLTSVALNGFGAGFKAAELLNGMMTKRIRKPRRIVIEAMGVVCRRSTDTTGTSDAHLAAALRLIRDADGTKLSVDRVVKVSALSRTELERRFRDNLGRSIHEEIQIARLNLAKKLLLDTQLPITQCAALAGFNTSSYFNQFFAKHAGKTPRRYRGDTIACARRA